jgi:gliding motility associated protien GldN
MKSSFGYLFGLLLACLPSLLGAQNADSVIWTQNAETPIITESSDPVEDIYLDDVVRRTMIFENRVLPYEHLREADIPWERRMWRVIDVREKVNLPFTYPVQPFFSILADATQSGEIKVFRDENFKEMMSPEEVLGSLNSVDTSLVFNPETYEDEVVITNDPVNPEDIKKYRVKEMWYFDKESSRMQVRILGIAPIQDTYDEFGEFKYAIPMFWVYYPEAREMLSRYEVFNEYNDAAPGTWYDLFEQRRFSSYIYKQSNVLDYRLEDYYPNEGEGIDRLLESERIKAELFNWEHDLWTY